MTRYRAPIAGLVAALLLTVAFWFLLYKPKADEQSVLEQETADLQGQQVTLRAEVAQLRDIKKRQVEIRAQLARLRQYIPDGPAQPQVIRQLQVSGDRAGVDIISVAFGEPLVPVSEVDEAATPLDTGDEGMILANIPVTMVIEGGYFQAVDFFRRLEVDVPRALLVQNLAIAEAEDGFPTMTTTWGGQLFTVVPTSAPKDVDAAEVAPDAGAAQPAPSESATETPAPSATESQSATADPAAEES
jgi:Tfp pilus assembly protein PilO